MQEFYSELLDKLYILINKIQQYDRKTISTNI